MKYPRNTITLTLLSLLILIIFYSCDKKPIPEELPESVRKNLNLLQEEPQFIMYMNFRTMRASEFWNNNISDSLLNAERTFGSMLNTFKVATGASISKGLDEMYYSNSWVGENAVVLKGVFDRNKLNAFLEKDTMFSKTEYSDSIVIYMHADNNLYFFFKDNFTLCASNYIRQIDKMIEVRDTSHFGLLLNKRMMKAIEEANYKDNLWMVSTEKSFIRGIFVNFIESKIGGASGDERYETDSLLFKEEGENDSLDEDEYLMINKLYKGVNSIAFSAKMRNDLKFLIQCECVDERVAKYFVKVLNGMITISRLSSAFQKDNGKSETEKILESININRYDSSVFVDITITNENIAEFRKNVLLSQPD